MKKYVGTKTVKAVPMNELAAVEKGYARENEDNSHIAATMMNTPTRRLTESISTVRAR